MTEQNFKCWGRLIAFGAVLIAGCSGQGGAIGVSEDYIVGGHIEVVRDTAAGVNCYHDAQSSVISCVKVKP